MSGEQGTDMLSAFKLPRREKYLAMYDNLQRKRGFIEMITQEAEDRNLVDKITRRDLCVKVQSLAEGVLYTYLICLCSFSH